MSVATIRKENNQQIIKRWYNIARQETGRRAYHQLFSEMQEYPQLAPYAINAFSMLGDSRSFFPVAFHLLTTENAELQKRCLQYFCATGDPRGIDLIDFFVENTNRFANIISDARVSCETRNKFEYHYIGSDADLYKATKSKGRFELNPDNLHANNEVMRQNSTSGDGFKPQTYVILPDEKVYLGGFLNEHVDVAQGSAVIAAGEIELKLKEGNWEVEYINNRSNGFLPHRTSFNVVSNALKNSNVRFEKRKFDHEYPRDGFADLEFIVQFMPQ